LGAGLGADAELIFICLRFEGRLSVARRLSCGDVAGDHL
jgi:hypothetical protein